LADRSRRWQNLIEGYRLLFDRTRLGLIEASGARTEAEAFAFFDAAARDQVFPALYQERIPELRGRQLPPPPRDVPLIDYAGDLVTSPTMHSSREATCWLAYAGQLGDIQVLLSSGTQLFVLDSEIAVDVIGSRNDEFNAADMCRLPFPSMWVEFDQPVDVKDPTGGRLRAISFLCHRRGLRCASLWFDARDGSSHPQRRYTGVWDGDPKWPDDFDLFWWEIGAYVDGVSAMKVALRNIYDFLTCRNFDYVAKQRPAKDFSIIKKLRHLHGAAARGLRQYRVVKVNATIEDEMQRRSQTDAEPDPLPSSVDVAGVFHRWTYCRACSDVHRHDLIGQPCRRCGETVGPFNNIRIEKFWHAPHVRGSGPRREFVRHTVP
jgi:hypothetical protein